MRDERPRYYRIDRDEAFRCFLRGTPIPEPRSQYPMSHQVLVDEATGVVSLRFYETIIARRHPTEGWVALTHGDWPNKETLRNVGPILGYYTNWHTSLVKKKDTWVLVFHDKDLNPAQCLRRGIPLGKDGLRVTRVSDDVWRFQVAGEEHEVKKSDLRYINTVYA